VNRPNIAPYLPLVRSVVNQMLARLPAGVDRDDLTSAGVVGLIHAVRQFDDSRGVPFEQYARIRIRGAVLDELRSLDPLSRTSRRGVNELRQTTDQFLSRTGRAPSSDELASEMGISRTELDTLAQRSHPLLVMGFDDRALVGDLQRLDFLQTVRDPAALDPAAEVASRELAVAVSMASEKLTVRQRLVIILHYMEGCAMNEIAEFLEVTEGRISQLHSSAIEQLKRLMGEHV